MKRFRGVWDYLGAWVLCICIAACAVMAFGPGDAIGLAGAVAGSALAMLFLMRSDANANA